MAEERLTQAAYAKRRGATRQAVFAAIKDGRIATAIDEDGKIDPDLADRLWDMNTDPRYSKTSALKDRAEAMERDAQQKGFVLGTGMAIAESKQIESEYKAKLAKLDYETKMGQVVLTEDVEKEAFRVARVTRDAMLAIPDRMAAELAGTTDPFLVHKKLMDEIRNAISGVIAKVDAEPPSDE
jgi:hypothetical protein